MVDPGDGGNDVESRTTDRRRFLQGAVGVGLASVTVAGYSATARAAGGDEKWSFETSDRVESSPTVVGGTVYVGNGDGNLHALDASTGAERWTFESGSPMDESPTVVDGTVFVPNVGGDLYVLDAEKGPQQWRTTEELDSSAVYSPTVADGTIYLTVGNSLRAYDTVTGREQWRYRIDGFARSPPTVVGGTAYFGSEDTNVHAVDLASADRRWRYQTGGGVHSTTVADGTVYAGNSDGDLYALDAGTGDRQWRVQTARGIRSSPTVADGTVYVGSKDMHLYALDARTGDEQWRFQTGDWVTSSPTVADGTVYFGSWDNNLYALDARSGDEQWRVQTGDRVRSSPTVVDGTVYVGSQDGSVYALDAGVDGSSEGSRVLLGTLGHHDSVDEERTAFYPASFEVRIGELSAPDAGEEFEVPVSVTNTGDREGTQTVEVDAESLGSRTATITLEPGESTVERYSFATTTADSGELTVRASSEGDTDSQTISISGPSAAESETPADDEDGFVGEELLALGGGGGLLTLLGAYALIRRSGGDDEPAPPDQSGASASAPASAAESGGDSPPPTATTSNDPDSTAAGNESDPAVDVETRLAEASDGADHRVPSEIPSVPALSLTREDVTEEARIGSGGQADVYRATVPTDSGELTVALKEPRMADTMLTETLERLVLEEAETWQKLDDHDHIVSIVDFGSEPFPWIAMEYMEGGHLGDRAGEMDDAQALWTAIATTRAVRHAHRLGVAHLDLKPQNILFRSVEGAWDVPKVADWGLSKQLLEHTQSVEGMSPHFASPEQFEPSFGETDDVTDVFQLGAVLYVLFTGRLPFEGSPTQVMNKVLNDRPKPPSEVADVPPELDDIVLTALATEKADRYESVLYLRDDLLDLFESL